MLKDDVLADKAEESKLGVPDLEDCIQLKQPKTSVALQPQQLGNKKVSPIRRWWCARNGVHSKRFITAICTWCPKTSCTASMSLLTSSRTSQWTRMYHSMRKVLYCILIEISVHDTVRDYQLRSFRRRAAKRQCNLRLFPPTGELPFVDIDILLPLPNTDMAANSTC